MTMGLRWKLRWQHISIALISSMLASSIPTKTFASDEVKPGQNQPGQNRLGDAKQREISKDAKGNQEIESWVNDLNSNQYASRQNAFLKIWKAGPEVNSVLEATAEGPNLELAASAKWLILLRKLGAPEGAGESLSNLSLLQAGDFHTLIRLAKDQQWGAVVALLEILTPEQRTRLQEDTNDRESLLWLAFENKQYQLIPAMVDSLYPPVAAKGARKLWRMNGVPCEEHRPTQNPIDVQVFEKEWDGDIEGALRMCDENGLMGIGNFIRQRHERWAELAAQRPKAPTPADIRDALQLRSAALQVRYLEWSDQESLAEPWKKILLEANEQRFTALERTFELICTGMIREGLGILAKTNRAAAVEGYLLISDYTDAFRLCGIEDIHHWDIDEFVAEREQILIGEGQVKNEEALCLIQLTRTLHRLGQIEAAEKIDAILLRHSEKEGSSQIIEIINRWNSTYQREKCLKFMEEFLNKTVPLPNLPNDLPPSVESILDTAFEGFAGQSSRFLLSIARQFPRQNWRKNLHDLNALSFGVLPEDWSNNDFREFSRKCVDTIDGDGPPPILEIAALARELGFHDLAITILASSQYTSARQMLFETLAEKGDLSRAVQGLETLTRSNIGSLLMSLKRSKWLSELGRTDESESLREIAMSLPRTTESLVTQTEILKSNGFADEAAKLLEFAWDTIEPASDDVERLCRVGAKLFEDTRPDMSLRMNRMEQLRWILPRGRMRAPPSQEILLLADEYAFQARCLAANGDFEQADRWVRKAFAVRPDDIDLALKIVPIAEAKSAKGYADSWFQLYADHQNEHLKLFPKDAMYHNNLAWLSARLDRDLDSAIEHSTQACEIKPNETTYMDTLAEVEFRRGNIDRAIEITVECRKLDAKDDHHKKQLARFAAAKKTKAN